MKHGVRPLTLVLAAGLVLAAPAAAHAAPRCGSAKGHTVEATSKARVYERGGVVLACARGSHRRYRLGGAAGTCEGSSSGCRVIERVRAAGSFVAYADVTSGGAYGDERFSLFLLDVATGTRWMRLNFGVPGVEDARLNRLALRATGDLAWTTTRGATVEVWRGGVCSPAVLDAAPEIDGGSLTRHGTTIAWRHGAERRTTEICPGG
ncbi:MAG TPA: hypothetical protein VF533_15120 [Solirubrobacteraceae bacterium]